MKGGIKVKRAVSVVIILVILFSFAVTASAAATNSVADPISAEEQSVTPRQELTRWYFRMNNGVVEQRLWSITFGRWLTDWHPA